MSQTATADDLIKKVQMLIEQNELLRKHNLFLLEENTSIEREFVEYKRQSFTKEQAFQDEIQALTYTEQQRNLQFEQQRRVLQAQLRALEQGIDELYNSRG